MRSAIQSFLRRFPRLYARLRSVARFGIHRQMVKRVDAENSVEIGPITASRARIDITGRDNRLRIGDDCVLNQTRIRIEGSGNSVLIGSGVQFTEPGSVLIVEGDGCTIEVGDGCSFVQTEIAVTEGGTITIGEDCMFAFRIDVRNGDSHAIYDIDTGARINQAADVRIGDHVWVGAGSTILKGASIGMGSVVGSGSIVTGRIPGDAVAVGSPATVKRSGIRWTRSRD